MHVHIQYRILSDYMFSFEDVHFAVFCSQIVLHKIFILEISLAELIALIGKKTHVTLNSCE